MADLDGAPSPELRALAESHGVLVTYLDHDGVQRGAGTGPLVATLEALGVPNPSRDPAGALAAHRAQLAARPLDLVVVVGAGAAGPDAVIAKVPRRARTLECELSLEGGQTSDWTAPVRDDGADDDGRVRAVVGLPRDLPPGYHELRVRAGAHASTSHLLVRPVGGARGRGDDGAREAGVAAPLFTLHGARTWGCGDLADLDELARLAAPHGATVVATLPLLAGSGPGGFEASPYVPLSRTFWHDRWIDVDAAVAAVGDGALSALAKAAAGRARAATAATLPYVDGERDLREKRGVLEALLARLGEHGAPARAALDAHVAERPALEDWSRFRAAGERHGADWARWPAPLREGRIDAGDVDAAVAAYHCFAQWLCDEQLQTLASRLAARDQVLSLDLPLGVHPHGYDVWRHRGQYLEGLSVGAPPDRFFPMGQVWGFAPPRLAAARADGHARFRAALVHHLNVAAMLRIDHVLGTQRLFCVPDGAAARDGVYLRMPLDELLAVVAIEAQRHKATVVGEDLGTVDAAVRRAMQRDGVRRSAVVQLAITESGPAPFVPPAAGSVASFSTHDLATFSGWWHGRDVEERVALGQVDAQSAEAMRARRAAERARLATLVPGATGAEPAPPPDLYGAINDAIAQSEAGVALLQLDDVLGELDAVNLPGTGRERPNWQRRTAVSLEELAADGRLAAALDAVAPRRAAGRAPLGAMTRTGGFRFSTEDEARFAQGTHAELHEHLGAHVAELDGERGTQFAVWAPNAAWVEVVGDFNGWDGHRHPLARHGASGIWEGFVPHVGPGARYKFRLESTLGGDVLDKADPFATRSELAPRTASVVHVPGHQWHDADWCASRASRQSTASPIAAYEVHLGSWRRDPDAPERHLRYRELAPQLVEHATTHGFTHVELLPVMEHPLYGSWGYQLTGYFAPTARYGDPDDFAAFVDELHGAGLGVLLDWAPAHFPDDPFALARFDGSHLYEHPDPRRGVHPDWTSLIFNYERGEVRSFLVSSACFWLERYHADGLRFDAVASMLYLDYSRAEGEWVPNHLGGNENLDAVELLRVCNEAIHEAHPGTITIAEESTTWPKVTAPISDGGLGFDYKWDLGWMHDTLEYLHRDPVHRRWHHEQLTFRSMYFTSEQFVLPLSHDEVVHGKGSLFDQMFGDERERLAGLRLLFGYQLLQPGKKLLFMGDELGQRREWAHDRALDWSVLEDPGHAGLARLVAALNRLYRDTPALHRDDLGDRGFSWLDADDRLLSVLSAERHDGADSHLVIACNATPEPREGYRVGLPEGGRWALRLTSDDASFGGSGHPVPADVVAEPVPLHRRGFSAALSLPPLGFVVYAPDRADHGPSERTH